MTSASPLPAPAARLARVQAWPIQLRALLERRRRMPFRYGLHDCCQLARRALEAQTGVDPAAAWDLRPYRTHAAAAAALARLGGLEALPIAAGLVEVPVPRAARGDIVLLRYEAPRPDMDPLRLAALGVCDGLLSAFPGRRGLLFRPTLECAKAWSFPPPA